MADENDENSTEMIAFGLIAMAGDARSKAFEALRLAKEGKFDEADDMMKQAGGEHTEVNVMLVHAQDHLMTSILAQELIAELIDVHKRLAQKADR